MPDPSWNGYDVVVIDGRSGSGKTSLTERLVARMRLAARTPQVLHVESLYPGWEGLAEGSSAVVRALAEGGYRRYDWVAGEFAEWVEITAARPLIIEGCGALTRENVDAARAWASHLQHDGADPVNVHGVWLECPVEVRKRRALARDGETYQPYWDRWAEQEDTHYAQHRPCEIADEVLNVS